MNEKSKRNEETKREQKKWRRTKNEINRRPSKNQTHKISEEIKLVVNGNYMQ